MTAPEPPRPTAATAEPIAAAPRVRWVQPALLGRSPLASRLPRYLALGVRGWLAPAAAARAARAVLDAESAWTSDFGGEQFCLGRAFYTHLETSQSALYFRDAAASDARVERALPGLQAELRALLGALVGTPVAARRGWCGAGVHVFPPGEAVARRGGVVHADAEGLTDYHREHELPALSLVVMLQAPERGGGLRLWDQRHGDCDELEASEVEGAPRTARLRAGDALLFDSYRLHQIEPFGGARARISATLHAAEVARGRWESWF